MELTTLTTIAAAAARVDTGDTAWMLTSTALVLFMTIGLGLFYAGLVRSKNPLNTFMMCVSAIAIAGPSQPRRRRGRGEPRRCEAELAMQRVADDLGRQLDMRAAQVPRRDHTSEGHALRLPVGRAAHLGGERADGADAGDALLGHRLPDGDRVLHLAGEPSDAAAVDHRADRDPDVGHRPDAGAQLLWPYLSDVVDDRPAHDGNRGDRGRGDGRDDEERPECVREQEILREIFGLL